MNWRVIEFTRNTGYMNMAIDEAICEAISSSTSPPTIRFYGWDPNCISIGYFQSIEKEVNLKRSQELGVDVVRRRTGGGAVYHDREGEITYSLIAPESIFPKDILQSYRFICAPIIDSLLKLGLNAEFKPINDIIVSGKKVSGNAQTRRNGVLLQHGTVLFSVDVDRMFEVLSVSDEKIRDKLIKSVKDRVTSVSLENPPLSKDMLYRALLNAFIKDKEFSFDSLSDWEISRSNHLCQTKYSTKEWNFMR